MDFHTMKRKELQALCKKHGISANLKSTEMVDRLTSLLKQEKEETIPKHNNDEGIKGKDDSEIEEPRVKKVRFSPQNQVFEYTPTAMKRATRRSKAETKAIVAEAGKFSMRSRKVAAKCNGEGTIVPHAASEILGDAVSTETQESLSSSHVAEIGNYSRRSNRNAPKSIGEDGISLHAASEISSNAYSSGTQVPLSTALDTEAGKISRKSSRNAAKRNGEDIFNPHSVSIMSENADSSATQVPLSSPLFADAGKVVRRSSRNAAKSIGEDAIRPHAAGEISGIAYSSGNQVLLSTSLDAEAGKISRKSSRNTAKRNGEDIVIPHSVSIMSENARKVSETQVPLSSPLVVDAGKVVRRSSRHAAKCSGEDMGRPHVVSKISGKSNGSEAQVPASGSLIPEAGKQSKKSSRNAAKCSGEDNIRPHTVRMTSGNADSRETHVPLSCPLVSEEGKVVRRSNRHEAKISGENKDKPHDVNDVDSSKDQVPFRQPVAELGKVSRRSRQQASKCSGEDTGILNAQSKVSEDADSSETQVPSSRPLLAEAVAVSRRPRRNAAKCIGEDTDKPHVVSKISGKGDSRETQAPLRKSSRNALKRELDAVMPAAEIAENKKRNKAVILSAEEEERLGESTIIQTESAALVIAVAANNDLNVSARKQVLESSVRKGKETRRKALTEKQLGSSHVTTVSNEKELTGSKVNRVETMDLTFTKSLGASEDQDPLPSAEEPTAPYTENVNRKEESDVKIIKENIMEDDHVVVPCHFSSIRGDSVSKCSAEVELGELQDNYKVVSSETMSPTDGFTADSVPDFAVDTGAVDSGGDLNDDDLVGIRKTPVQMYSNKVKLKCDNLSSTRPVTSNGALRDNQSDISENRSLNSKRTRMILMEDEEDVNKNHYGETTGQTGFFVGSNEIQDMTQLSELVIAETDTERSTKICLTSSRHSFPQATPIRASPEGLDNESSVSFSVHNLTANIEELKDSTMNLEGDLDSTLNLIGGSDDQNPEHFADEPSTNYEDKLNMKGEDEETLADDNIIESDGVGSFSTGPELMEFANDYMNAVTSESNIPAGWLSASSQADLADFDEGSEAGKMISSSCDMDHFSAAQDESPEKELPNAELNEENMTITSLANEADFALNLKKGLEIIESLNNMPLGHIRDTEDTQLVESDETLPHTELKEVELSEDNVATPSECYHNESADFNKGIAPTEIKNFLNSEVDRNYPTQNDQGKVGSYDDNETIISVANQADFAESSVAMDLEKTLETTEPLKSWDFDRNEIGLSDSRMYIHTVADQVPNACLKNGCEMIGSPETINSTGDLDNHNGLSSKLQSKIGLNDDVTITFEAYKADLADFEEGGETKESSSIMKSGVHRMDDQFAENEKILSPRDQNDAGLEDGNVFVEPIRSDSNQDCKILMDAELLYNYNSEEEPAGLAEISAGTTDIQDVNFCMDDHIDGNDETPSRSRNNDVTPSRNRNNDVTPSQKDHNDAGLDDSKVSVETIRPDTKQDCKILKEVEQLLYNYLSDGEPSGLAQHSAGGTDIQDVNLSMDDHLDDSDGTPSQKDQNNTGMEDATSCMGDYIAGTDSKTQRQKNQINTCLEDGNVFAETIDSDSKQDLNTPLDAEEISYNYHSEGEATGQAEIFVRVAEIQDVTSCSNYMTAETDSNNEFGVSLPVHAITINNDANREGVSEHQGSFELADGPMIINKDKNNCKGEKENCFQDNITEEYKDLSSHFPNTTVDDAVEGVSSLEPEFVELKDNNKDVDSSDITSHYNGFAVANQTDFAASEKHHETTELLKNMNYGVASLSNEEFSYDKTPPRNGQNKVGTSHGVSITCMANEVNTVESKKNINTTNSSNTMSSGEDFVDDHLDQNDQSLPHKDHSEVELSDDDAGLEITEALKIMDSEDDDVDVQFDEDDETATEIDNTGVELKQEDYTVTESVFEDQRMDIVEREGLYSEYSFMVPVETEECLFDENDEATLQKDNTGVELRQESVIGDQRMEFVENESLNLEYNFMVPVETEECLSKHSGETTGQPEKSDDVTEVQNVSTKYIVNSHVVQFDVDDETTPHIDNTGVELKHEDYTVTESVFEDQRMDIVESEGLNLEYSSIVAVETEECLSKHFRETTGQTGNSDDATEVQNFSTKYNVNSHNVQFDEDDETKPHRDNFGVDLKQEDYNVTESVSGDQRMDIVESEGLNLEYSFMVPLETEECLSKHSGQTTGQTENSDDASEVQNVTTNYNVNSHDVQLDEDDETAPRNDNTEVELKQDDLTLTESVIGDQRMDFVDNKGLNSEYSVMDPTETEECLSKHSGETTELTENSDDATEIQNVTSEYNVHSLEETSGQAESGSSPVGFISYSSLVTPENATKRTTHVLLTSSGNDESSSCIEKALASSSPSKALSRNDHANTEALEVEAHTDVSETEVEVTSTTVLREESHDQDFLETADDEPLITYENQIFERAEANVNDGEASTESEQENNYIDAVFSEIKLPIDGFPEANQVNSSVEPNVIVDWEEVLDTKEKIDDLRNEKTMLLDDKNKEGFNDLIENMKGRRENNIDDHLLVGNHKTLLLEDENKEGFNDLIDQKGVGIQNADHLVENDMNDGDENEGLDLEQTEGDIHNHFSENANNVQQGTPFRAPPESPCFRNQFATLFKHDMKENFSSTKNVQHNGNLATPKTSSRRALEDLGRSNR